MEIIKALNKLGLTDKEPDIYLTLLKLSGVQPASIIASRANLNRTTTYKILINLAKKGLITKTQKHGIICFFAEDPEKNLKKLIEKQQNNITEANSVILDSLPLITSQTDINNSNIPKVRFYEGIDGIKQIYEAVLKEGVDYYRYGDLTKIYGALGNFTDEFIKKRNELNMTSYAIMPIRGDMKKPYSKKKHKDERREPLYIPYDIFPIEGEIRIFGNKVSIVSLQKEQLIGVIIESSVIYKMFYSIFMLTWNGYKNKI